MSEADPLAPPATPPAGSQAANVLRVLNGRLAGAERAWGEGERLSVGYQFWQDIVLREPRVRGIAVELVTDEAGQVQLAVLSGEASLLGSTVPAGSGAILPPYVPVSLGGIALAWGDPASSRWMDAAALAGAVPVPPPPPPTAQDQALALIGRGRAAARGVLSGWRLVAILGVALMLLGATMAGPALDALGLRASEPARVARALDQAGLTGLDVTANATSGGVFVTGIVTDEAARARAEQVLQATQVPGTVDVRTTGELASASVDVARLRGIETTARPIGHAAIELHTPILAPDTRTGLIRAIRADVSGIGRIAVVEDLVPTDDTPVRTVADATKKVSTVVTGDPAYIRTADGARYFPGSILPSGHRLAGIKDQTIVLEKNGRQTRITF